LFGARVFEAMRNSKVVLIIYILLPHSSATSPHKIYSDCILIVLLITFVEIYDLFFQKSLLSVEVKRVEFDRIILLTLHVVGKLHFLEMSFVKLLIINLLRVAKLSSAHEKDIALLGIMLQSKAVLTRQFAARCKIEAQVRN